MKRFTFVVGISMLLGAVASHAQTPAPRPGPEHKKMLVWVGDWTLTEEARESGSAPWTNAVVTCRDRPILGGFFLEFRCQIKTEGREINHVEIESVDPVAKMNVTSFFNSDGESGHVMSAVYAGNKEEIKYTSVGADGKSFEARCTWTFGPDFMSMSGSCERLDNGKWVLFRKLTGTKAAAK